METSFYQWRTAFLFASGYDFLKCGCGVAMLFFERCVNHKRVSPEEMYEWPSGYGLFLSEDDLFDDNAGMEGFYISETISFTFHALNRHLSNVYSINVCSFISSELRNLLQITIYYNFFHAISQFSSPLSEFWPPRSTSPANLGTIHRRSRQNGDNK